MEKQVLTERELELSKKYPKAQRWKIFGTVMAHRFIAMGLANGAFSLLLTTMISDMGMSAVERAGIVNANSVGQLIATFIFGFLIDRVNVKWLYGVGLVLLTSITCFLRGVVTDYTVWWIIMFVWGLTYSSMLVGSMKIVGLWFNRKQMTDVTGYFTLSGPLGQLISFQIALVVCDWLGGWKHYFMLLGILLFVVFILFMIFYKNRPNEDSEIPASYEKKDMGIIKDFLAMIKVPRIWMLWLAEACEAAVITMATTYGQIVLQGDPKWGLDPSVSRQISSLVMVGVVVGYFVIPKIIALFSRGKEHAKSMHLLSYFCVICGFICSIVYLTGYISYSFPLLCVLAVIGGLCQAGYIVGPRTLTVAQPEVAGGRAGAATTIAQLLGRLGLVIVSAALGSLAVTYADSAVIMILPYAVLFLGPVFMIIYIILNRNYEKKMANQNANQQEN